METELSNIVPNSKLNTKLLNNNDNKLDKKRYQELNNSQNKDNSNKQIKIPKINKNNTNVNFSKSNCLSKLFFFWPRTALQKSSKEILTQKDVCNVSDEQSINYEIKKIKNTFLKYNSSNKFKKHSLVITIILSNYKLLLFLFILDLFNVGIDYARMFFYRKIIFIFSKQDFFPKRNEITFLNVIKNIKTFPFNIVETVLFYIFIRFIRTLIFNHI